MSTKAAKEAQKKIENYKKALQFLEERRSCTYNDFLKSIKMAEIETGIPCPESVRQGQIDMLQKGIETLQEVS